MRHRTAGEAPDEDLRALERRLAGTLRPLEPPEDVIQRLRGRIRFPDRFEIAERLRDWQRLMIVLGGVLSGLVAIVAVARALFHLVGRRS